MWLRILPKKWYIGVILVSIDPTRLISICHSIRYNLYLPYIDRCRALYSKAVREIPRPPLWHVFIKIIFHKFFYQHKFGYTKHGRAFCTQIDLNKKIKRQCILRTKKVDWPIWVHLARPRLLYIGSITWGSYKSLAYWWYRLCNNLSWFQNETWDKIDFIFKSWFCKGYEFRSVST